MPPTPAGGAQAGAGRGLVQCPLQGLMIGGQRWRGAKLSEPACVASGTGRPSRSLSPDLTSSRLTMPS